MKQTFKLRESELKRMIAESVKSMINEGIWDAVEQNEYYEYDQFVDFIKNYYAKGNDQLAYQIEDDVNGWMCKMMDQLDNKYGHAIR